jgi:hypothetical protein
VLPGPDKAFLAGSAWIILGNAPGASGYNLDIMLLRGAAKAIVSKRSALNAAYVKYLDALERRRVSGSDEV